ncbi:hypothetical protein [Magnetospirillum sulfuroxidans]|uniref:Uncharacterized protein n=1 Tax=Magnetospirillum sulfuroxidans TaxID=611300 RepID=A0ABS5IBJ0_9PROT|nr:hypothetical protein [Magnetospirillum sulfuroxidans]MBR9971797.1 hypothetical protein [Magnetospirillum sulfuroxidans]
MFSRTPLRMIRHVLLGLAAALVFAIVFGAVVMLAWNAVIPDLFGLPPLNFWHAVAILVLVRVLTGRFTPGRHGHHRRFSRTFGHRHGANAALYSAWWDAEGASAFQAYADKQTGESGRGCGHH